MKTTQKEKAGLIYLRGTAAVFYRRLTGLFGIVLAAVVLTAFYRADWSFEAGIGSVGRISPRLREVLADTQGKIQVTLFMRRDDLRYRPCARFLKGLASVSTEVAGARMELREVDPRRDIREAARLIKAGAVSGCVVFESGRRTAFYHPETADFAHGGFVRNPVLYRADAACAAILMRLQRPAGTRIYWLKGHGEGDPTDTDLRSGYSMFASELARRGFENVVFDSARGREIPSDCEVLVLMGPRQDLAAEERTLIQQYLEQGGRLLFAVATLPSRAETLLQGWGVSVSDQHVSSELTFSGREVVAGGTDDHPLVRNLKECRFTFPDPRSLLSTLPDREAETAGLSIRPFVTADPGAKIGGETVADAVLAVTVEKGAKASADLAFRPTRIVLLGSAAVADNGTLRYRGGGNADLLSNCVLWLAGLDIGYASPAGEQVLQQLGLTRREWLGFTVLSVVVLPGFFLLLLRLAFGGKKR